MKNNRSLFINGKVYLVGEGIGVGGERLMFVKDAVVNELLKNINGNGMLLIHA